MEREKSADRSDAWDLLTRNKFEEWFKRIADYLEKSDLSIKCKHDEHKNLTFLLFFAKLFLPYFLRHKSLTECMDNKEDNNNDTQAIIIATITANYSRLNEWQSPPFHPFFRSLSSSQLLSSTYRQLFLIFLSPVQWLRRVNQEQLHTSWEIFLPLRQAMLKIIHLSTFSFFHSTIYFPFLTFLFLIFDCSIVFYFSQRKGKWMTKEGILTTFSKLVTRLPYCG